MVFRHIDGSVFIFFISFYGRFLWAVYQAPWEVWTGHIRAGLPSAGAEFMVKPAWFCAPFMFLKFGFLGDLLHQGLTPLRHHSFFDSLEFVCLQLRLTSSRVLLSFFCPPSTPCGMMLGSRIPGLSAFAGSSFLSVLRISAALGCVGVLGLGLLRR